MVQIKRIYERKGRDDGYRILIDRLWPRGMSKEEVKYDEWAKELSPSDELRKEFGHDPAKWKEFQVEYKKELKSHDDKLDSIAERARKQVVTILYSAKDTEHNNAVVVKNLLDHKLGRLEHTKS